MSKEEKNKAKDNIWLKQLIFFGLVLIWILAIVFKNQMNTPVKIIVFLLLVIGTLGYVYRLNKAFFGVGKDKK